MAYHTEKGTHEYLWQQVTVLVVRREPVLSTVKRRKLSWFDHVCRHDTLTKIKLYNGQLIVVVANEVRVHHKRSTSRNGQAIQSLSSLLRLAGDESLRATVTPEALEYPQRRTLCVTGVSKSCLDPTFSLYSDSYFQSINQSIDWLTSNGCYNFENWPVFSCVWLKLTRRLTWRSVSHSGGLADSVVNLLVNFNQAQKKTRSSPRWWSGCSTIRHDVLNLWSPICDPLVWGTWGPGMSSFVIRPWVLFSSPLTNMVYLLPYSSYLAGPKSVSTMDALWFYQRPVPFSKLFQPPVWRIRGERGGWGWAHSVAHPWVPISSPLTHTVYLLPFLSYLAGSKSVSARPPVRPPVRPGYDDKYRSRSHRFVEWQLINSLLLVVHSHNTTNTLQRCNVVRRNHQ